MAPLPRYRQSCESSNPWYFHITTFVFGILVARPEMAGTESENLAYQRFIIAYIAVCRSGITKNGVSIFRVATLELIVDITRYSSYTKLLRVVARILRFVRNCKSQSHIIHELNCNEIEKAKEYCFQTAQYQCFLAKIDTLKGGRPLPTKSKFSCFNPFLKDGYLRLGGRLQFSDIPSDTQYPLLLDGNHPFVHLLIQHTHICLHHLGVCIVLSELRSTFWILKGRHAINGMYSASSQTITFSEIIDRISNLQNEIEELRDSKPSNPVEQQMTLNFYKKINILKDMIVAMPSGAISFISPFYSGSISDKEFFVKSNLMDVLEPNDVVITDKGFQIEQEQ
ncbi:hypothetical protein HNY73_006220 [Argiope bruennichi]|uniref:DDE Tnp4 domain-containing protein n=1 Tax=Argiope bruennichi TaxID=94029 RepID=A0A8T0FRJ7_ARGBR|nr:hypothetical protein HNY73_006220 [Argiope bruennichi]